MLNGGRFCSQVRESSVQALKSEGLAGQNVSFRVCMCRSGTVIVGNDDRPWQVARHGKAPTRSCHAGVTRQVRERPGRSFKSLKTCSRV